MQQSFSMERNGIPLCFTMFGIRILYTTNTEIKYGKKDLKYIKLCIKLCINDGHVTDRIM